MALSAQGRAWFAAISDGQEAEAVARTLADRGGTWSDANRDGADALAFAAQHGAYTAVETLARMGARAINRLHRTHALLDWTSRGDRAAVDAYERGVPSDQNPYPWEPIDAPARLTIIDDALSQGWFDLAKRWWDTSHRFEVLLDDPWSAMALTWVDRFVAADDVHALTWLAARMDFPWSSLSRPLDDARTSEKRTGNLLALAAQHHAWNMVPWLIERGVDMDGTTVKPLDPTHVPSTSPTRPWLHLLNTAPTAPEAWLASPHRAWLNQWLDLPGAPGLVTLKNGRFSPNILLGMIQRHDLLMIDRLVSMNDFRSVEPQDALLRDRRLPEHVAMLQGDPQVVRHTLARLKNWNDQDRHNVLTAAFRSWSELSLHEPFGQEHPSQHPVRAALLTVLMDHGVDVNAPASQKIWFENAGTFAQPDVIEPALLSGWSPLTSANAWPEGPHAYASKVLANIPLAKVLTDQPGWTDRWFGLEGHLHDLLTPAWWQGAWEKGTSPSPAPTVIKWLIGALPDGVLSPTQALGGLMSWSRLQRMSNDEPDDPALQTQVLHAWHARFGDSVPQEHPNVPRMMQQMVNQNRLDWMQDWHAWFPSSAHGVGLQTYTAAPVIEQLADWGVNINAPTSAHRSESLLQTWLSYRSEKRPSPSRPITSNTMATFHANANIPGLHALIRRVGVDEHVRGSIDHRPDEPLIVFAARTEDWSLVDLLMRANVDVHASDKQARTALSYIIALHDKPAGRDWEGRWQETPETIAWVFRLDNLALRLLEAGASLTATIPGKDRTLERALANPRHQPWLRKHQALFTAVERALLQRTMTTCASPQALDEQPVPPPRRRL